MLTQNFCIPLGPFPLSLIQIFSGLLLFIILTVLIVPTLLQVLVKILKSINEDSPAVPALLTDYILKVLCPT